MGENGSGKSTLLEALSRKCGIHIWDKPKRHIAHENPYETRLSDYVDVTWANGRVPGSLFRAETFREFADFFDDVALCDPGRLKYHGGRILNILSHGQGILSYLATRYQIARALLSGRARGRPLSGQPDQVPPAAPALERAGTCPVYHCHALADPAGAARRADLQL